MLISTYISIQPLSLHELLLETCCRHAYDIVVPPCRLSLTRDSFVPATVGEWNSLNLSVRNLDTLFKFKKAISSWISTPIPRNYSDGPRKLNIILAQLRCKASFLNYDLCKATISYHNLKKIRKCYLLLPRCACAAWLAYLKDMHVPTCIHSLSYWLASNEHHSVRFQCL